MSFLSRDQNIIDSPEKIASKINYKKLRDKRKASVQSCFYIVVVPSSRDHSGTGIYKTIEYKRKNKWKNSVSREHSGDDPQSCFHSVLPSVFVYAQYNIPCLCKQPKSGNI